MVIRAIVSVDDDKFSIIEANYNQYTEVIPSYAYRVVRADEIAKMIEEYAFVNVEKSNGTFNVHGALKKYKSCNNIVILARKLDQYIVHYNGKVILDSAAGIMEKALSTPLANGKIVTKGNKKYIVPLRGQYMQLSNQKDRRNKDESLYGFRGTGSIEKGIGTRRNGDNNSVGGRSTGKLQIERGINRRTVDKAGFLRRLKETGYDNNIDPLEFRNSILTAKESSKFGESVDAHSVDEYKEMTNILFDNGMAGVSVERTGNITSLFKHNDSKLKQFAVTAMAAAIHNGGDRCDCYSIDEGLPLLYCRCGMIPICKIKFNREFAPDNWDYAKNGEPDIVFMAHCGDTPEQILTKNANRSYKQYKDYKNIPYISDSDTEDAYTLASRFRDDYIKRNKAQDTKEKSTMAIIDKLYSMLNRQKGESY